MMMDYGMIPAIPAPGHVVQVTNIAPQATRDQMLTLFSNIGKIEDIRLYPTIRDASVTGGSVSGNGKNRKRLQNRAGGL